MGACLPWTVPTQRAVTFVGGPLAQSYGIALTASGPAEVALLPLPRLSLGGVRLAATTDDAPLAEGGALKLQLNLFALLAGRIEVNTASLEGGTVSLPTRDDDTRWAGPRARAARLVEPGSAHPRRLTLSQVTVTGRDPRDGQVQTARDVDLTVSWPSWSAQVDVAGAFRWNAVPARFTLTGLRIADLATGARSPFVATADWPAGSLSVEGEGSLDKGLLDGGLALTGSASLRTRSLPETLGWMGGDVALSPMIEAFALAGAFEIRDRALLLPSVRLEVGDNRFEGAGAVSLTGGRPAIQATLAADSLNLAPLLAETLRLFGRDDAESPGWSGRSLALHPLMGGDLDLRVSAGGARMGPLLFEDVAASVLVRRGGIEAALSRATLQGGLVKGRLGLTPAADEPNKTEFRLQGAFDHLDLGAVLVDLGQDRSVFGAARGQVVMEGTGAMPDTLMRHLDGRATLSIDGGALAGIDLVDVVHRNGTVATGALARRNGRTAFEHASLTLRIVDGVGEIVDGVLRTPALTGTLSGAVVLPERRFEARAQLRPRAAADGTARPGPTYAIVGPWDAIVVRKAAPEDGGGLTSTGALRAPPAGGKPDLPAAARAYAP
ncbi:AsmA-like C-terminal region-containing protein [Methylobacterium sp. J-090]|uniref:AsmA family protein n=1 Tax=Methylobacterium sp. J-090 TaxID=2836666 RepID=UPI001FB9456A|nr:AsmA-like C-terminal region-containing protein [Methylobacterium sp. J-090]MCJ2080965.1 AsmA family protein [Methylobacterium sp. J-090]